MLLSSCGEDPTSPSGIRCAADGKDYKDETEYSYKCAEHWCDALSKYMTAFQMDNGYCREPSSSSSLYTPELSSSSGVSKPFCCASTGVCYATKGVYDAKCPEGAGAPSTGRSSSSTSCPATKCSCNEKYRLTLESVEKTMNCYSGACHAIIVTEVSSSVGCTL